MPLNIQGKVVGLEESIRRVEDRYNRIGSGLKIRINDKQFTQPLGKITHSANEFSKSLEASNARVIAFGASAAIIGGVSIAFKELVVQAVKFEKILTDINVVLGTTTSNLEKFGKNLFNVARNTSQGIDIVAEAALEFSRQGLSMEETLRRTNDALILTRLTGMKAADAVSGLTAAMNGFADAGLSTTNIINKLAAVDVQFAVSADDLIDALARAGAVAQDAGVSFDQLIGAVTSAQQITARGGAVIGNSFKTIFTRVQRSSTIERLQELGVAVRDIRGSTLPALTVLKNLATQYDTLADTTKAAVAEQVGGVFQINILKAALKDLNRENSLYAKATEISNNATDQAQVKNEQLQKTISSLAAQTSLTIQELSANIGELALSPGISKMLDALNSVGQTLNDLFGKDSEGLGSDFAKGIVKGFGNVLSGPGVVLAIGVFAKLFKNALSFASGSLKDVLGIVTAKDKERMIQESIVSAMSQNKDLALKLNSYAGDKLKQEELMLKLIKEQTNYLAQQQKIASGLAPTLLRRGVSPDLTIKGGGGKSGGTASAGLMPESIIEEKLGALQSGYSPGIVKSMDVRGLGKVVYNSAETVKSFAGMKQPAIMPPKSSKAGTAYKKDFEEKHGFDPYAFGGFIPNFMDPRTRQQKIKDVLSDPANKNIKFKMPAQKIIKSKNMWDQEILRMFQENPRQQYLGKPLIEYLTGKGYDRKTLQAMSKNPSGFKVMNSGLIPNFALGAVQIGDTLRLPKARMAAQTTDSKFSASGYQTINSSLTALRNEAPSYTDVFSKLKDLGINTLSRTIYFTNQDHAKKAGRSALRAATKQKAPGMRAQVGGRVYEEKLNKILKPKGYKSTSKHPTANVDFIAPGKMPIEAKYSSAQKDSLMAKSLKIYGDKSLENFLKQNQATDLASQFEQQKLEGALTIANKVWKKGSTIDDVKLLRLSGGFVPNFVNETVQERVGNKKQKLIIKDGDSVEGVVSIAPASIDHRLAGVDAIEKGQKLGSEATALAESRYRGIRGIRRLQETRVPGGRAAYGRGLFDDRRLAQDLVRKGLGIPDIRYMGNQYGSQLKQAKSSRVGIWNSRHKLHPKRAFYENQQGFIKSIEDTGTYKGRDYSKEDIKRIKTLGIRDAFAAQKHGYGVRGKSLMSGANDPNKNKTSYSGLIPNFADDFIVQALSPHSGFYNKGNFVKDKNQAEKMSRSRAVMVSNILLQNRKIKSKLFQLKGGSLMGDSGIFDRDKPGRAAGLIPNFANPLEDAIAREKSAGIPASMIKVDQDDSLRSKSNPMGLGVINTRDEPFGIKQGIRRAREMGVDPKTHGAFDGLIPNFNRLKVGGSPKAREKAGLPPISNNSSKEAEEASGNLMMGMFALTSATYALEGALGDSESAFAKNTKVLNGFIMGASQGAMVFSGLNDVGKSLSKSQNKFAKNLGGPLLKGLGAIGGIAALAVPAFQAIKENTTLLDTGLDTLRKSAEKTSKGIESLGNAVETHKSLEDTRNQLVELSNSNQANTFNGEIKRLQLESKLIKEQQALADSASELSKHLNLTQSELDLMTSGTTEGMKKLQEAMLHAQQTMAVTSAMQGFASAQGGTGIFGDEPDPIAANIQELNLASMVATSVNKEDVGRQYNEIFKSISDPLYNETNMPTYKNIDTATKRHLLAQDRAKLKDDVSKLDIDPILKAQMGAAIDSRQSLQDIAQFLGRQLKSVKEKNDLSEDEKKEIADGLKLFQDIKKYRQQTLRHAELSAKETAMQMALQKSQNSFAVQALEYTNKYAASLGGMTTDAQISADTTAKLLQADLDLLASKSAINNKYNEQGQKYISDLFSAKSVAGGDVFSGNIKTHDSEGTDVWESSLNDVTNQLSSLNIPGSDDLDFSSLIKMLDGTQNIEDLGSRFQRYFRSMNDTEKAQAQITALKEAEILHAKYILDELDQNRKLLDKEIQTAESKSEINKQGIDVADKENRMNQKSLSYLQKKLDTIKNWPHTKFDAITNETLDKSKTEAQIITKMLEMRRIYLSDGEGLLKLQQEQNAIEESRILTELDSLNTAGVRLDEEKKLRESMSEYRAVIAKKVENEIKSMEFSAEDDTELFEQQKEQKYFAIKADTEYTKAVNDSKRAQEEFNANWNNGRFLLDATNEMAQSARDFAKEMVKMRAKLADGEFFREGQRSVERDQVSSAANLDRAKGKLSASGHSPVLKAKAGLEVAQAYKDLNIQLGQGSLFADTLSVKIAEANEQLSRFGETMANTTFDATKEAFKGLVTSMSDGTKSMSDRMLDFVGTIVSRMHEQLLDRAATQFTKGMFDLFDASGFGLYKGGMVQGYANGGITSSHSRQVPSMLTSGEYVVRKKVVDKLGKGSLDSINESGSLEDLYEKPNDDLFDITSEGAAMIPPIMRSPESLGVASHGSAYIGSREKSEHKLDSSEGDNVIGKFASIVDNFGSRLARFNDGGGVQANTGDPMTDDLIKEANKELKKKQAIHNMASGSGYMSGSAVAAYQNKKGDESTAPTAPVHQMVNTQSRLNLDSRSDQMSAKFRATDQYSQDYGKYLLDKYEYDVQKKNAKVQRRANLAQTIASLPMTYMMGNIMSAAPQMVKKGISKVSDKVSSHYNQWKSERMLPTFEKDAMSFDSSQSPQSSSPESTRSSISSAMGMNSQTSQQFQAAQIAERQANTKQPYSQSLQNSIANTQTSQQSNFAYTNTHGANLFNTYSPHQSQNQTTSTFNQAKEYVHNLLQRNNEGGLINSIANNNSVSNLNQSHQGSSNTVANSPYSSVSKNNSFTSNANQNNIQNNPYSYFYRGGNVSSSASRTGAFSYFNQGGNVSFASSVNPYSYFYKGGSVNSSVAHSNPYSYFNQGGSVNISSQASPYSYFHKSDQAHSSIVNSNPYSYLNKGDKVNISSQTNPYSYFHKGGQINSSVSSVGPYSYFNQGGKVNMSSNSNPYSYSYRRGDMNISNSIANPHVSSSKNSSTNTSTNIHNPYSYFNQHQTSQNSSSFNADQSSNESRLNTHAYTNQQMSTFVNRQGSSNTYSSSPYSYSNKQNYNNVNHGNFSPHAANNRMQGYSSGGKVYGPGGIDKVGPVLLDKGEYVIKASSVNKVEKKYPGFFDRLNSMKMKDGGLVDSGSSSTDITNSESNESSSSNVTVNINVSSGGNTSVDGGDGDQQAFAAKVKDAVLGVISQEKRVGGMLRGR